MFGLSAVDKAYKLLLDQEQKKRALDVIQAGKEYVEHIVSTMFIWLLAWDPKEWGQVTVPRACLWYYLCWQLC